MIKKIFILLIVIASATKQSKAQSNYIIAGKHTSNDYYHSYTSDTTIQCSQNSCTYSLDVNHDGVYDFSFILNPYNGGMGDVYYYCQLIGLNNNKVATDTNTTCLGVHNCNYNDTISTNLIWQSSAYVQYFNQYFNSSPSCVINFDSIYVGLKVKVGTQVSLYGWIKVDAAYTGMMVYTLKLSSFACESNTTGISPFSNLNTNISIYPNPAASSLQVTLAGNNSAIQNTSVEIMDMLGNKVKQFVIHNAEFVIDLAAFANGVYYINLKTTDGIVTKKFIVQR